MIVLEPPLTEENWPAGPAGELLTNIITLGLGLAVEKTYVSTILKCPLQNLEFWPRQAKNACLEIIWREIALVNPRAILAMGVGPGQLLTKTNKQMFFLRPNPFLLHFPPPLQPIPLQVTLGLGSILEEPELKPEAWRDIKKAMRLAGLT
jgi:DNA polymerase